MKKFEMLKSKNGQSTVEYVLIIAAVVAAIFLFKGQFTKGVESSVGNLFNKVEDGVDNLAD